jgi:CheY-like chemotaxis protein/anti-sigma regulatory factor (Ser/Thr protein kinase)
MLRPLLLNQSVELIFDDADHIPGLYSDEGKISQILRNFISNALKFTEKGEVRVSARFLDETDHVCLSVSDTGIGIAPLDRELIFQDFVQIDHPIQRKVKGTGLGLPLSRKLATFLGGSVELESEPGKGSTFTVRVPRTWRDPSRTDPISFSTRPEDASGRPVLVIEDNPETILTYRSYLRDSGFHVVAAATTREAENLLDQVEPAAIILDIVLRSEDTWAFMAGLKRDPHTAGIPVIVASTIEDQAKGFHLGAAAYLVKPVERPTLLRHLREVTADSTLASVLIIDDNQVDRYLLRQHLRNLPVTVFEEHGGLDGIARAVLLQPGLIFLDLTMPDMTGFEVVEELRRRPETEAIPVVIITSRSLSQAERHRLMNCCSEIIGKNKLDEAVIRDAVRRILKVAVPKIP